MKKKKTLISITQERFVTRVIFLETSRNHCWLFWRAWVWRLERMWGRTAELSGSRGQSEGAMWSALNRDTTNGGKRLSGSQQLPASHHLITGEMKGPRKTRGATLHFFHVTKKQQKIDAAGASCRFHFLPRPARLYQSFFNVAKWKPAIVLDEAHNFFFFFAP